MLMRTYLGASLAVLAAALVPPGARLEAALPAVPPSHVVIVMEENHTSGEIIGSSDAPYINSLAASGALMTQSFAITHPSEPNYLALFSGSTQGVTDDGCPYTYSGPNLGAALLAAGKTFVGYSESMPSAGYTGCDSGTYARKHNPWVNFTNVPAASNQMFSAFPSGNFEALPTVSFVIPNLNDDMHDGTVQEGDAWLKANLDAYVQWANANNSLLIVTWDEDDSGGDNQIATIICGQMVQPGLYPETINHYNTLRTVEDLYGLPPSGSAAQAAPITDIWKGSSTTSFIITANAGPGGSIAPSGAVQVAQGASQTFNVTPAAGSTITGVTVDGAAQGPLQAYTFTNVQAAHTISATFGPPATYVITASAGAGGAIQPSGSVTVTQGGNQAFTITPAAGFSIANVAVDAVAKGALPAYTFSNVLADHTIAATFKQNPPATFTLTATAGAGGAISPAGAVQVAQGGSQTFTITAASGYSIAGVTVDGTAMGAIGTYTFTGVSANHTIAATFKQNPPATFTLTATAGVGGAISPAGAVQVAQGGSQTFTITPASGYSIAGVSVDGAAKGALGTYTFTNVTANHTIAATFTQNSATTFIITATAGEGGSITPSGNVTVAKGASATFTIKARHHHRIRKVKVDGVSIGARSSYTFLDVQAPHTITASFSRKDD